MKDCVISEAVRYIGVDDKTLDLFESQYIVPNGVSYNSYVILDEKVAVMDTADQRASAEWMEHLITALDGRSPNYLIVSHLEPDHSANIAALAEKYPAMQIVASAKAVSMLPQFFDLDLSPRCIAVKEGDTLPLGPHTLQFVMAPMIHWPEVMVTYEQSEKILFSADAFGKFGALDAEEDWTCEARRYYFNIVGKYGMQVLSLFKKVEGVPLKMILPLHGYIWRDNFSYILNKYTLWASYTPEVKSVLIVYGTMYGDNACVANTLANKLSENGVKDIRVYDASVVSSSVLLSDSFKYSNIVIISPTYNMTIYPDIEEYLTDILRMGLRNRKISIIENGSWAPNVKNLIKAKIENSKLPFEFLKTELTVRSSLKEEDEKILNQMALEIKESLDR